MSNLWQRIHTSWQHAVSSWKAISFRGRFVSVVVLALGAGMLLAGWTAMGYAQTALADLGSTVLLAVPLVLIGRVLSERVRESAVEARAVASDVQALRSELTDALGSMVDLDEVARRVAADLEGQDRLATANFEDHPNWSTLKSLLVRADSVQAISLAGTRVDLLTGSGDRIRLRYVDESLNQAECIEITLEDTGGIEIGTVEWVPTTSIQEVVAEITQLLQRGHRFSGGPLHASELFSNVGSLLTEALRIRREGEAVHLDPILEIPKMGQWAVTTSGIASRTEPYQIGFDRIHDDDLYRHVYWKPWVDKESFEETLFVARDLVDTTANWFVRLFDVPYSEDPF
jgi:hypothetical protein